MRTTQGMGLLVARDFARLNRGMFEMEFWRWLRSGSRRRPPKP